MVIAWAPRWEKKEKKIDVVEKKSASQASREIFWPKGALGSL